MISMTDWSDFAQLIVTIAALIWALRQIGANTDAAQVLLCAIFTVFTVFAIQGSATTIRRETWKAIRDRALLTTRFVGAVLLTLVFLMLAVLVSSGLALADYVHDAPNLR
jgi:hypothetical protein